MLRYIIYKRILWNVKFDDFEQHDSVYRWLSCLMSSPIRYKFDFLLLRTHWSHIQHPHFLGLDCHKNGFYSGFPLHTLPNRCPISPIETICRQLRGSTIRLVRSSNTFIVYYTNMASSSTIEIIFCSKLPLSVQTKKAFFPFLPF